MLYTLRAGGKSFTENSWLFFRLIVLYKTMNIQNWNFKILFFNFSSFFRSEDSRKRKNTGHGNSSQNHSRSRDKPVKHIPNSAAVTDDCLKCKSKKFSTFLVAKVVVSSSLLIVGSIILLINVNLLPWFHSSGPWQPPDDEKFLYNLDSNVIPVKRRETRIGGWSLANQQTLYELGTTQCDIDRRWVDELSAEDFEENYRFKKPVIIQFKTGATAWTDPKKWTVGSLKRNYGDWSVFSGNSREIVRSGGSGEVETTLKEFINRL